MGGSHAADAIDAGWALKMGDMADAHGEKLLTGMGGRSNPFHAFHHHRIPQKTLRLAQIKHRVFEMMGYPMLRPIQIVPDLWQDMENQPPMNQGFSQMMSKPIPSKVIMRF